MIIHIVFTVLILALISANLSNLTRSRATATEADTIVGAVTQVARAMHLHYARNPGLTAYPALSGGAAGFGGLIGASWNNTAYHAPRYATDNIPALPGSPPPLTPLGFAVHYNANADTTPADTRAIAQAAARFGPIACTATFPTPPAVTPAPACSTTDIDGLIVHFVRAIDMTLVDQFLPLNGERDMFGNLNMLKDPTDPATDAVAIINTQGQVRANSLMNLNFGFTDNNDDGEVNTGDTLTNSGSGVLITSDGALGLYDDDEEAIRIASGVIEAFTTGRTGLTAATDTAPIRIDAATDTISDVGSIITDTIDANDAVFDNLVLN